MVVLGLARYPPVYRGGHQHRQVSWMPNTDLIPDIRSKEVKDRIFSKNRRQRSCPLPQSFFDRWRTRGRGEGRGGHPFLIDHISSGMFPTPRKRIREHTWRKFLTKLKIMYKEMGLALYCDLYRSLTIKTSKDRFNVKKHCGLYLDFSNFLRTKV